MPVPSPSPPVYLYDQLGNAYLISVNNDQIITPAPVVPPPLTTANFFLLNDAITTTTWKITILPSARFPAAPSGVLRVDPVAYVSAAPTQILCAVPNGAIYAVVILNGILATALPTTLGGIVIGTLVPQVQNRLEENAGSGDGEFWSVQFELRTGIIEAINDLMMLVGRPTRMVNVPFNLTPNTVWQTMPKGIFLITDIRGWASALHRVTLHDMDYVQSSWQADWEADTDPAGPVRWFPVGMNMFGVHPAPSVPQTVTLNAIAYPATTTYPYSGAETVPFHNELFVALEEYASGPYSRLKEGSAEFQQSLALYKDYLSTAQRLTVIEDRCDPVIFSPSFGAPAGVNPLVKR